jgi:hypothetical protein
MPSSHEIFSAQLIIIKSKVGAQWSIVHDERWRKYLPFNKVIQNFKA